MVINDSNSLVTVVDAALLVDRKPKALYKMLLQHNIQPAKIEPNNGHPLKLYDKETIFKLYNINYNADIAEEKERKERTDKGRARKVPADVEENYFKIAFAIRLHIAGSRADYEACRQATRQIWDENFESIFKHPDKMTWYFYNNRGKRFDGGFQGRMRRNGWVSGWRYQNKKLDHALMDLPTLHFDWLQIGEDIGILGKGHGAGTIFWLDDHTSDAFVYDDSKEQYKGSMPKGLYLIDGWTGVPLDFQPGEVNSYSVATIVIRCACRYGLPRVIGMENSRAMRSLKLEKLLESLYPEQLLKLYKDERENHWLRTLFDKNQVSPIMRNVPNIPRFPFKARMERFFQEIVKFDAVYFPQTYTGGGLDPVQRRLSTTPAQPPQSMTPELYFEALGLYLSGEYMERTKPLAYGSFTKRTGVASTPGTVWDYYGGNDNPGTGIKPDTSKICETLYWLTGLLEGNEKNILKKTTVKASMGHCRCRFDGEDYYFVDTSLADLKGRKITVILIPEQLSIFLPSQQNSGSPHTQYAALFLSDNPAKPAFLNICRNTKVNHFEDIGESRQQVRSVREHINNEAKEAIKESKKTIIEPGRLLAEAREIIRGKNKTETGVTSSTSGNGGAVTESAAPPVVFNEDKYSWLNVEN